MSSFCGVWGPAPDSSLVLSGSTDTTVRVWQPVSGPAGPFLIIFTAVTFFELFLLPLFQVLDYVFPPNSAKHTELRFAITGFELLHMYHYACDNMACPAGQKFPKQAYCHSIISSIIANQFL